ncbi:MAG: hypothetical protein RQ751_13665 [Longimicrobiales bacterium]|nr:hypothetical protein [Longimicrobiales bacterium]
MSRWSAMVAAVCAGLLLTLTVADPAPLAAQAEALGRQTLGRPYWHVFLSYAIGWALILGWVVSVARRLAHVERRLQGKDGGA